MTKTIILSAIGALALFTLAGCTTSQMAVSRPIGAAAAHGDTPTHVYFLPKGIVTAKISGTPRTKPEPKAEPNATIAPLPGPGAGPVGTIPDEPPADPPVHPAVPQQPRLSEVTTTFVPDARFGYVLDWRNSGLSSDELKLTTNTAGLLTLVETKATDPSPDIVKAIADFVTARTKPETPQPQELLVQFDPASCEDIQRVNTVLASGSKRVGGTKLKIDVTPACKSAQAPASARAPACPGICHRVKQPYVIALRDGRTELDRTTVYLPNEAPILSAELTRAAFVTKTTKLTFTDGFLTETDIKQPSQALAFASIPLDIARAVLAVPSALFQFKVTRVNEEKGLLSAEAAHLKAQKEVLDALKALQPASSDGL